MAETVTNASVSLFDRLFGGDSSIVALVIAAIAAIIAFMEYRRSDFSLRRLEQVISPLFEMIEQTMMRNAARTDNDTVSKVIERIKSEPVLAGGKLRAYRALSTSAPSFSREWDSLCKRVSRDYDWLCRWNNIPRRSIRYRLQHYKWRFAIIPVIAMSGKVLLSISTMFVAFASLILAGQSILSMESELVIPALATSVAFLSFTWLLTR